MKKLAMGLVAVALTLTACTQPAKDESSQDSADKLRVVTSFYPLWFMAEEIAGDRADVVNLAGAQDVHEYEPSPQDLNQLYAAELVIYQGAELEPWVEDVAPELAQEGVPVLAVNESLSLRKMEAHEHEDEDEDHADGEEHEQEHGEYDPHTWLDPILAQQMVDSIVTKLGEIDPDHAADYAERGGELKARFAELDQDFAAGLTQCSVGEAITSHDAFGYLAERYDFTLHPIAGLSTADEPSAKLLAELKAEAEEGITHILTEQSAVTRFAETLAAETGLEMLPVNPLGRGTLDDSKDFFAVMQENLTAFETALGCE